MTSFKVTYEGDLRTKCIHVENQKELLTDAPKDNQGKGEEFSPTDLVAVALGTCILTIMGIYAKGLGADLTGISATVSKEMSSKPPRRIGKLTVVITCPQTFDPEMTKKLEEGELHCPVHLSLHPEVEQDITFKWGL